MEVPYKSYIMNLGDCCGLELLDFCSEDCLEKYANKLANNGSGKCPEEIYL
jgi:hypothetical protein